MSAPKRTAEQIRRDMTAFCVREEQGIVCPRHAYIAALTSAAHLCDQISREATRAGEQKAAKDCGDFIWAMADAIKALPPASNRRSAA